MATYLRQPRLVRRVFRGHAPGHARSGMPPPGTPAAGTSRSSSTSREDCRSRRRRRAEIPRPAVSAGEAGPTFSSSRRPGSGGKRGTRKGEREPDRIKSIPGFELRGAADRAGRMSRHACRRKAPRARRCIPLRDKALQREVFPDRRGAPARRPDDSEMVAHSDDARRRSRPTGEREPDRARPAPGFELRGKRRARSEEKAPRKAPAACRGGSLRPGRDGRAEAPQRN